MSAIYDRLFYLARQAYGEKKIAVCPFYENGAILKQILSESFGIKDIILIDNGLSKFNPDILAVSDLKDMDTKEIAVLLNSTNKTTNAELVREIREINQNIVIYNIIDPIYIHEPEKAEYFKEIKSLLKVRKCVEKNLVRVGGPSDGGYVMLDDFSEDMKAYSFGIGEEVSWDYDIASKGIIDYMYDPCIAALPCENANFVFESAGIADIEDEEQKLHVMSTFLRKNGDMDNRNLILKMDVEGSEWEFIKQCSSDVLDHFIQMTFELHDITDVSRSTEIVEALKKLNQTHQVVWIHGNAVGRAEYADDVRMPIFLEVTYANRRRYSFEETEFVSPLKNLDAPNREGEADFELGIW